MVLGEFNTQVVVGNLGLVKRTKEGGVSREVQSVLRDGCRDGCHQQMEKAEFLGVDEAIKAGVGIKEKRLCIHEKYMHEQRGKKEPS